MTRHFTDQGPVRVTQLASGDLWAGAESQLFALVVALRENAALDVDVVLLNDGLLSQRLRDAAVPVTVFDEGRLNALALLRALHSHTGNRGTQVLHTHRLKENVLGSALALAHRGLRTMRTVHGAPEHTIRSFDLRGRGLRQLDWLCARFIQSPIVCVSRPLEALCRQTLPASRLRVATNGIDVARLTDGMKAVGVLPRGERRFRIGFFGRLTAVKRIDLIVEIARCLEDEAPGDFGVYLFGEGPLQPTLERLVRERHLEHCVHFMGFTGDPDPYLRAMDFLLLTSDHEGLPMIVLEAMALRVHVVSRAVGEVPAVLDDGRVGSLVEGEDPRTYARVIAARCASAATTVEMTEQAFQRVITRYSVTTTASEYSAIYAALAKAPKG